MTSGIGEPLVIVPYDPDWPRRFAAIRMVIQRAILGMYLSVEHVGSTSVPGLAAKPIIDVDVVMRSERFDGIKSGLEALGYIDEGDLGIRGRVAFYLRDEALRTALGPHHLYVVGPESPVLRDHRDFRNFMLLHPEWIEKLNALKQELAGQYANDREGYQRAKSPMVEEVLRLARAEAPA
ncbi:MAG TPA: GrpB family protein [Dehalococcoidia bacterium]|nr:GrpB family protein [Dehalococcoidia bacterium]